MYNQNHIYPYRRNTEIIKAFFAKPLTLVIAIAYAVNAFLNLVVNMFSVEGTFNVSFDLISIMMSVAFFLLYFQSRNGKPDVSYKAPTVLLKINAILTIVLMGLLLLCLIFIAVAMLTVPLLLNFMPTVFSFLYVFALPLAAVELVNAISMIIFSGSIRKSVSTVYLHDKGAGCFGVTSFLLAAFTVVSLIINTLFLPSMLSEFAEIFKNLAQQLESYGGDASAYITIQQAYDSVDSAINLQSIISNAMSVIIYVLLGVFALKFKSCIKKQTTAINTGFDSQDGNYPPNPENGFIPQQPSFDQSNNPYMQNSQGYQNQPNQPDSFMPPQNNPYQPPRQNPRRTAQGICPVCGSECMPGAVFCGKCGAKLR